MDELIRTRMHEALGVEQPDPGLRSRVMSSLPVRERPPLRFRLPSFQWTGGLVAALLALAVVAGLVYVRNASELHGPARTGPIGQGIVTNRVPFQCSLPVIVGVYPPTFIQIQLPSGLMVNKSIEPDKFNALASYDVQAGTWVPVQPFAVSPDGRSYAYGLGWTGEGGGGATGTIHVVDVVTGTDRQVWAGAGAQVVGFLSSGVYFVEQGVSGPALLRVVDPARPRAAHRIGALPTSWGSGLIGPPGMFWLGYDAAGDPDRVEQMDLTTGAVITWLVSPTGSTNLRLLGLDGQGYPIVVIDSLRVLLLTGENQSVVIAGGSDVPFQPETAFGDAHGIWFGEPGSIWLYDRASGLRKVFAMPVTQFPTPSPIPKFIPTPSGGEPTATPTPLGTPSGVPLSVFGPCK